MRRLTVARLRCPLRCRPYAAAPGADADIVGGNLLPLVNKLQSVFAMSKTEFDLPQLVVVGSQSSGKSSVIEALVGKDFLPRGRGIVTRVPLVLQLVKSEQQNAEQGVWAEFTHDQRLRNSKFVDFGAVKHMIEEETMRLAGKGKGVANAPIVLRVHSPNTIPLTLVDTPGLTRIAVADQPSDIENQIRKMVSSYIEKPNSIILAVSPANQDIATSDALRLARTFDPSGERTVGILTKLDLMDKGTDCLDTLSGRLYPLRLGFVGVVCRSQQDIETGVSLEQSLQNEQNFFLSNPAYRAVADVNGTRYLAQKCNRLLTGHIRKVLPKLKVSIKEQIKGLEGELARIGEEGPPEDVTQKGYLLIRLITNFSTSFRNAIEGNVRSVELQWSSEGSSQTPSLEQQQRLNAGARIRHVFNDVFDKAMQKIDPLEGLSDRDIQAAIRNAAGPKPAIFLPEAAFELLAKRQIAKLREPALDCAERVHNELVRIMLDLDGDESALSSGPGGGTVSQYANLNEKIVESGQKLLRKTIQPTLDLIRQVIAAECSYINTNHRDFIGLQLLQDPARFGAASASGSSSSSRPSAQTPQQAESNSGGGFFSFVFGSKTPQLTAEQESKAQANDAPVLASPSDREQFQINLVKTLLRSYFELVRKNVQDITVKIVWRNVVERAKDDLYKQLMVDLYHPDQFAVLLKENPQIASQRIVFRERLNALRKAKDVLKQEQLAGLD